jgi:drug/metabolite transporter (DMT)-like permease
MMENNTITPKYVLKNIIRFAGFLVLLGIFIFVPAGTLSYWQGWVFLAAFGFALAFFMLYGMLRDPNMPKERSQKAKNVKHWDTVILNIYTVFLVIMVVLAPLDGGRFHWSHVPVWVNMLGLGLMIPSFALLMWVTVTNTYLSPMSASRMIAVTRWSPPGLTASYATQCMRRISCSSRRFLCC